MAKVTSNVPTQMVKVQPSQNLPAYLQNRKPMGTELLKEYIVLPRIKVIQKTAGEAFAQFNTGDVIAIPSNLMIRKNSLTNGKPSPLGGLFIFTPLFFFPSWCVLNDFKKKGVEPVYLKYTTDRNDPLVALCKDPKTREMPHPTDPKFTIKNCEQLNYVCLLEDVGELTSQPIIMTFMRGSYRMGSDFNARIRMSNADIFARRWVGHSKYIPGSGKGDYYGIEIMRFEDALLNEEFAAKHQEESPWATLEQINELEKLHLTLAKQYQTQGIKAQEDAEDAVDATVPSAAGNNY